MRKRVASAVFCFGLGIVGAICATATGAQAGDRHAGYYYPEPATREVYEARSELLPEASRATRIGFVRAESKRETYMMRDALNHWLPRSSPSLPSLTWWN